MNTYIQYKKELLHEMEPVKDSNSLGSVEDKNNIAYLSRTSEVSQSNLSSDSSKNGYVPYSILLA